MNCLDGQIVNLISDKNMTIIDMNVSGSSLKTIIIETFDTASFLKIGNQLSVMFKETEVNIAKDFTGKISFQNRLNCSVKSINKGKLLSQITLNFHSHDISAIIATSECDGLELKENDTVLALIKATEIMVAPKC